LRARVRLFGTAFSAPHLSFETCSILTTYLGQLHLSADSTITCFFTSTFATDCSTIPLESQCRLHHTQPDPTLFILSQKKMDVPRGPTIALPIPNTVTHHHHRRRPLSRSSSLSSSDSGLPSTSMAIPGTRVDDIPPALPPPRYNNDLEHGFDLAWRWQNEHLMTGKSKLAPIKPGSSLLGTPSRHDDDKEDIDVDLDTLRTASSPSRFHSVSASSIPSLIRSPPPSSGINQR
jgi:hypothetical protein